ncbi:unnamed protein product [Allacma fusca]|uniref:WD repeat-containing protein 19 n=1 Tax=Allacma fusca TaxID=39272 RepID=A0A8J2K2U8_9HEXA|nr:unnamed protein product [Allacma fusca]
MATSSCRRLFSLRNQSSVSNTIVCSWQKSSGGLLASVSDGDPVVYVHNRHGHLHQQITLTGNCIAMAWDEDGDFLAILAEGTSSILLWESHSARLLEIESNIRDAGSCLAWSRTGKILAYATSKGNLLVYNHRTLRKVPIVGKHTKRIAYVAWSNDSLLALATVDNLVSLNTVDGDSMKTVQLRGKPTDLKFGQIKEDKNAPNLDNCVSCIVGEKTLYMLKYEEPSQYTPMELGFQTRYGNLVAHHWHGDGYILVSFSAGFVVLVSSHHKEIGTELILAELKSDPLRYTTLCPKINKLAICYGDYPVQIHEAADPRTVLAVADIAEDEGKIKSSIRCHWSDDGQLLAIVTTTGDLHVYLTSVPLLGGASATHMVQMVSLTDLVICVEEDDQLLIERSIKLEVEPHLIAVGPYHLAACSNNRAFFYTVMDSDETASTPFLIKEYNSNIVDMSISIDYSAARCSDKIYLHLVEGDGMDERDVKVFPEPDSKSFKITAHALVKDYLIFGGEGGQVKVFHMESWKEIYSLVIPSNSGLKGFYPDGCGVNVVMIDKQGTAYYFDASQDKITPLVSFPNRCDGVLWDIDEASRHIFLAYCSQTLKVYVYTIWREILIGSEVEFVGEFRIFASNDQKPLWLKDGIVYSASVTGRSMKTASIYVDRPEDLENDEGPINQFERLIKLKKFTDAYEFCVLQDELDCWDVLGKAALRCMDLTIALKCYNKLGDLAMVHTLDKVSQEEDRSLAFGHVAAILEEYDLAEKYFLESSNRIEALNLRRDLQEWDIALQLAHKMAPNEVPVISKEFALNEEFTGDYIHALQLFEQAHSTAIKFGVKEEKFLISCESGLARCYIRCGQVKRGVDMAIDSNSLPLIKQCAELLESSRHYEEAANLYELCKQYDKAASLYIRLKQWDKVSGFLNLVHTAKIHAQYAKAKETEGKLLEAAKAYDRANDPENASRLYLVSDLPDEAIRVVKLSGSTTGATHVARYFEKHGDLDTALRFLIISKCFQDALILAFKNGKAELYAEIIQEFANGGPIPPECRDGLRQVAGYFEELKDNFKAGKYFHMCGDNQRAFKLLMRAAQSGITMDEDILMDVLTNATIAMKNDSISKQFIEFLLGEKDSLPKDPKYLLKYYIRSGKLVEASKTALIVSREEQNGGNYKESHNVLVETCRELKNGNIRIPRDVLEALRIVHDYLLVRRHVVLQNHERAARLLIRICDNISKFPGHAVQILTSAVVECQKAGLKANAMNACYTLMKPDYRSSIPPKYKQKFELMVRKSGKTKYEDPQDEVAGCPYCKHPVPSYQLNCPECRADIPFCIASGKHIIADDLTACPSCELPAIRSELFKLTENDSMCPLCGFRHIVSAFSPFFQIGIL